VETIAALFLRASAPFGLPAASASAATAHSTNPSPSIAGQKATRPPGFSNTVFPWMKVVFGSFFQTFPYIFLTKLTGVWLAIN
jgi:hypothetical protein